MVLAAMLTFVQSVNLTVHVTSSCLHKVCPFTAALFTTHTMHVAVMYYNNYAWMEDTMIRYIQQGVSEASYPACYNII